MTCTNCGRSYRSKAVRERAEHYRLIHAELRDTVARERAPEPPKRQRHLADSSAHRAGQA